MYLYTWYMVLSVCLHDHKPRIGCIVLLPKCYIQSEYDGYTKISRVNLTENAVGRTLYT